ncbi:MAG: YbhB/YbcL family Raf kinase inhibitor-like protein [Myxococcales bacterium]|nr:MAG: YbhB/YbcL family Raf kinase inhibitor-like protein [Myxococcales bacterium]
MFERGLGGFWWGAALVLLSACSEADPAPASSGGAGGGGGAGSGAIAGSTANAGSTASAGSSAGGPGGTGGAGGGSGGSSGSSAGSAGQPQAGGGAGGASGGAGGSSAGGSGGAAGGAGGSGGAAGGGGAATFALTSPAFQHGEQCTQQNKQGCMPTSYFPKANVMTSIGGSNMSPELNWTAGPAGTMSYVMCLHDLSPNTHWCLWNIPSATRQLAANVARQKMPAAPAGSSQDSFSGQDDGYMGPGAVGNVYEFRLYALKTATYAPPNAENRSTVVQDLEADDDEIVLGKAVLRGRSNPDGYN